MVRKSISILAVSVMFFQTTSLTYAQNVGQKLDHALTSLQNQASKSAQKSQLSLQTVISRADSMIATRLASLNTLSSRIQNDSRLTTDEKTTLSTDVQTAISGLTTLKSKIDADTDAATARTDAKQIVTNYYIYEIFEPKVRLLITLNNIQTMTTKLQSLTPQLTTLLTTFASQGKDTTAAASLIADINTQLQAMNTSITADITKVESVPTTPDGKSTLQQVRQDVSSVVKTDFAKIRTDLQQLKSDFKGMIGQDAMHTKTSTESSTITTTVSPSGVPSITSTQ